MNEVRIRNGYAPIDYRHGYFPHFQENNGGGILALFGKAIGVNTEVTALPTTINGITHTFKPGIRWFGNALQRQGYNTVYGAVEGFDRYIEGAADVICLTDSIQRLRAFATRIRYNAGDKGMKQRVDAITDNDTMSDEEKQAAYEELNQNGRFALSNFVRELDEYTNLLANKKSQDDRNMEYKLGRGMYNVAKALENRVAANMVAINPASWLTNFIPLVQGGAMLNRGELLRGMWNTLKAVKVDDGIVAMSDFLTNRRGSEPLVQGWSQNATSKGSMPMTWIDQFVSDSLIRARYHQNLKNGMSEASAMDEADAFVAEIMADRSKGAMPTLFNQKNPMTKLFTQFQLEVNNTLSWLFKDMPRAAREKGVWAIIAMLFKFLLGSWLFNELFEKLIGRRPALDPLGILNDTVGNITGYELPNIVDLGIGAIKGDLPSFEVETKDAYGTTTDLFTDVAENLPFVGGLLGGGRIPISSALPDVGNLAKAALDSDWSGEKVLSTIGKELGNSAAYIMLPFGGGQLKKIYQGLDAVLSGGSYTVDSDGNDILQYPVYNDTTGETILNAARAALFGKTSLPTAQDWIENDFDSLSARYTAVYQGMTEAGVDGEDAFSLIQELRDAEKTGTESEAEQERRILLDSDISGDGKSVVYYGLMASDKEKGLMDVLTDMGANMGDVTEMLLNVKDADNSNAKRSALANSDLTDTEKVEAYNWLFGEKQGDGSYISSRADDIEAFDQAGIDFDTFLKVQNQYTSINAEDIKAGEKATLFSQWVNGEGFTPEQAEIVKDCFTYFTMIPATAARYESFVGAGLDDDIAFELADTIDALEPLEGEDSVSYEQRWRAVVDSGLSEEEQLAALQTVSTEEQYHKFTIAYQFGVSPDIYVSARETLPNFDADGNGSYKQDEITEALESMSGGGVYIGGIMLPGGDSLTNGQKAVLWQLLTGSKSAKNNPYSVEKGQQVIDAREKAKEDGEDEEPITIGGIVIP